MLRFHVLIACLAAVLSGATSSSEPGELIQVVTPENQGAGPERVEAVANGPNLGSAERGPDPDPDNDSYVKAYRELHRATAERRNPHDAYEENRPYSTVVHSSYIEDDFYPELNYKASHSHRPHKHQVLGGPHVIYGAPAPVAIYRPEPVSTHHTVVGIPVSSPFHPFSTFLASFGFHKMAKLLLKVVVLKMILKFVGIVTLFLVLPYLVPKMKEKNGDDERLMDTLNQMTDMVWNGISGNEEQQEGAEEEMDDEEEDDGVEGDEGEDMEMLKEIVKDEKEFSGGPGKGTAVAILRFGVSTLNQILGVMLAILKAKNNNMDTLDGMMFATLWTYLKHLVKMWKK